MADLVIKNGNTTKTIPLATSEPSKPYIKMANGYLPLTANGSGEGLYVKNGNNTYKVVENPTLSWASALSQYGSYLGGGYGSDVGTLSIDGIINNITKVSIDGVDYTTYTNMPVKAGSIVTLWHNNQRTWHYDDLNGNINDLGVNETCSFIVPSTASGNAMLTCISSGDYDSFVYHFSGTTGWVKSSDCYPTLGNGVCTAGTAYTGKEGWKRIAYTDTNGNTAYANPYVAGSIEVKAGTAVKLQMIAGSSSSISTIAWEDVVPYYGESSSYFAQAPWTPTTNSSLSINRDVSDASGTIYDWVVSAS